MAYVTVERDVRQTTKSRLLCVLPYLNKAKHFRALPYKRGHTSTRWGITPESSIRIEKKQNVILLFSMSTKKTHHPVWIVKLLCCLYQG